MKKLIEAIRSKKAISIFVIYLRYLIGGAFVFASIPKIEGERFTFAGGENAPINTWIHFFETLYRSGIYWEFLGWAQLISALLLMTQRFASLAAIVFLPIILNIFVITVSLDFHGTPYITGLMLLANLFLLLWDYNKLSFLLKRDTSNDIIIKSQFHPFYTNIFWTYLGILLFITTVLYVVFMNRNPLPWFLICVSEGLIGLIWFKSFFKRHHKE